MAKNDQTVLDELLEKFDAKPQKKSEDTQAFLKRLVEAGDTAMDDNDALFKQLSKPAQKWYNKAVDAVGESEDVALPQGMEADDDEDEPKAKKGKAAKLNGKAKNGKASRDEDDEDEPKAKGKKAAKAKRGGGGGRREAKFSPGQKIKVLVKENPKREGTESYDRFEHYFDKSVKTVKDAIEAGVKMGDLHWDTDHEFISIT